MSKGMRVGYIRVSTIEQNPDRQLEGVTLDKKFIDKCSGKNTDRPELSYMMEFVREGDRVLIHSMDRMARNLQDLKNIVSVLNRKGVIVEFIKENLIFTGEDSSISQLLLSIMGAFAEFEYTLIKERQREGIKLARQRSAFSGRKKCLDAEQVIKLKNWKLQGMKITWIANQLEISRWSVYNYLKVY
jgi:DNA invertase Pin-like site-specific DNA recombinase